MTKARRILITDTTLRDGHQSLWATRMRTSEMLPILSAMDDIGFYSLEVWGGATFDSCIRFLDDDPWERLRTIKHHCPKTPLQMLLRGQNLVGYRHYGDDIVRRFVARPPRVVLTYSGFSTPSTTPATSRWRLRRSRKPTNIFRGHRLHDKPGPYP